ncbi:MAG: hypothetical protein MJ090_00595 [Clostridia bacterium]|nr:hypothetical protein [Clostridia bacterium]
MANRINKIIAVFLAVIFMFSAVPTVFCSAKTINGPKVSLTVSEIEDNGVKVTIGFTENPGIGAMTFSVMYDKNCYSVAKNMFGYSEYYTYTLRGSMISDHSESGYVSFLYVTNGGEIYNSTGTFLELRFYARNKEPGKHWFKIGNINPISKGENLEGCFANFQHDKFEATAEKKYCYYPPTADNPCVRHDYELVDTVNPTCITNGYSVYKCSICGKTISDKEVPALGHDFENEWTVDRPASKGVAKIISRHCKRCNEKTDIKYVSEDEDDTSGESKTSSKSNTVSKTSETSSKPEKSPSDNTSKNKNTSTAVSDTSKPSYPTDSKENSSEDNKENGSEISSVISNIFDIISSKNKDKNESSNKDANDGKDILSAQEIVDKIDSGESVFFGDFELPKRAKTLGDIVAKISVYLFGIDGKSGIIKLIFDALKKLF